MNKLILKQIEKHTDYKFAFVENGRVYKLSKEEEISNINCLYQSIPIDGYYVLVEYTCDNVCEIGNPYKDCIERGIYDKSKCSVYSFREINSFYLSYKEIENILFEEEK